MTLAMKDMLVSVIIPNYNYARFLREAIDGVLNQTHPNVEIIVVDDGSTDESRDVLESYGTRIDTIFQKNEGVSSARNNGVRASRGEFVAFLDADDSWRREKLERQVQRFAREPELGLVHVGVRDIDADGNVLEERLNGGEGRISDELLMLTDRGVQGGGSGSMLRRSVFDELGGFDTRLSTSADWDLYYRVSNSFAIGFVPEALLNYRVHGSNMHGNVTVMERDMTLAFEKALGGDSSPHTRKCYGNLFKNLSGSYFRAGKYSDFLRTAVLSLRYRPANISYFLQFPLRRIKRNGLRPW